MVATLQSRRDALQAKIAEKTQELKTLCLQEADLTGQLPPETPLEPGEPIPIIRKRVGTSFSFPQSLINNLNGAEDTLGALELECKVQTNIAEAALTLANDPLASKAVRRKHRLMYRQSQRNLSELETRLSLLKQGRHQPMKPQQIRKKPRPNTIDHAHLMREYKAHNLSNMLNTGSWSVKHGLELNDEELRQLHSLPRSSGSQSSNSPRLSVRDLSGFNISGLPDQMTMTSSMSQPNIQDLRHSSEREMKRSERRNSGRRQWDSQSAGGTLLPNQTYPESHQPNLNRAHSMGSVDGQIVKEKEWYETSLDSAPSPPLRTSSRLPTSMRLQYHLKEMQIRDAVNRSMSSPRPHPVLTRAVRSTVVDDPAAPRGMRSTPVDDPIALRAARSTPTDDMQRAVRSTPIDDVMTGMHALHVTASQRHQYYDEPRHLENYTPPDQYYESAVESSSRNEEMQRFVANQMLERRRALEAAERRQQMEQFARQQAETKTRRLHEAQEGSRTSHSSDGQSTYDDSQFDRQSLDDGPRLQSRVQNNVSHEQYRRYDPEVVSQEYCDPRSVRQGQYGSNSHYESKSLIRNQSGSQSALPSDDSQRLTRAQYNSHFQSSLQRRQYEAPDMTQQTNDARDVECAGQYAAQPMAPASSTMRMQYGSEISARVQYNPDNLTEERRPSVERPRHLNIAAPYSAPVNDHYDAHRGKAEVVDEVDATSLKRRGDGTKTPTQAYYHGGRETVWTPSLPGLPKVHPPHAVIQEEITFDTVVPFESPQNHTVVQAGIWQPYREVTKPFEMSDFYKYSTKFRQARQSPADPSPLPPPPPAAKPSDPVVGVYQPLRPMTCQPLERNVRPESHK